MNTGFGVINLYFIIYLLAPSLFHLFFMEKNHVTQYHVADLENYVYYIAGFFLLITNLILLSKNKIIWNIKIDFSDTFFQIYSFVNTNKVNISLILLLFTFLLFDPNTKNYRYTANISSMGAKFYFLMIIKVFIQSMLLWIFAYILDQQKVISTKTRISLLLLILAWTYSSSGVLDLFISGVYFLLLIFPKKMQKILTTRDNLNIINFRFLSNLLLIGFISIILYFSLIVGESIKVGKGFTLLSNAVENNILWFFTRLMEAFSTHYYSLIQFFDGHAYSKLNDYNYPLFYPLETFMYRLNLIFNLNEINRPEISSLSHLNFFILSDSLRLTEGTSSGLVGSFLYIFPIPIACLVIILYLKLILSILNNFFNSPKVKLTFLAQILILAQTKFLFGNPVDFLLIIDNGFIFLILLYLLSKANESFNRKQFAK